MTSEKEARMTELKSISAEEVRELFSYDPETGALVWAVRMNSSVNPGKQAGKITKEGRRSVAIRGRHYLAHRLVWLYVHGQWPHGEIDHINEDPLDNRISNLRVVNRKQNQQNISRPQSNCRSGARGVSKQGAKWIATIKVDGKPISLGRFGSVEEASSAYLAAKKQIHPFWNGSSVGSK